MLPGKGWAAANARMARAMRFARAIAARVAVLRCKSRRRQRFPISEMRPGFSLPPLEYGFGASPGVTPQAWASTMQPRRDLDIRD